MNDKKFDRIITIINTASYIIIAVSIIIIAVKLIIRG